MTRSTSGGSTRSTRRRARSKWQQTVLKSVPKIKRHTKASHANSTMATDGERLIAFFGSEGLYAYDLKGKLLWKKDLGVLDAGWFTAPQMQWETGSSPILRDGKVIILADVQKDSFLAAFDAKTGNEIWRTPRTDVPTWGSPTIIQVNGQTQILVNGFRHAGAYDFKTGKEIWKLSRNGDIPVPTPVASDGLIYITNAHGPQSPVYAIKDNRDRRHHAGRRHRHQQRSHRVEHPEGRRLHVHAAGLPRVDLHHRL